MERPNETEREKVEASEALKGDATFAEEITTRVIALRGKV